MKQKVLITGATGFVGAYLTRWLLRKGYDIRGTKRPGSRLDLLGDFSHQVEWVDTDITDVVGLEDAFGGIDAVCHCAAHISFHPKDQQLMRQINVEGTANVVNLCLHYNVKKLIHFSSIAALGRSKDRLELDENCQWVQSRDNSNYAISKYLAEQEVWRGVAEGLKAVVLSPSVIVGSRQWNQGMALFFKKIDEGMKVYPSGRSGFVDVRDVVQFAERMLQSEQTNERFILNAVNWTHHDFFVAIAQALGATPPYIKVGPLLAEIAWRVEWLKEQLLGIAPIATRESARSSVTQYTYRNDKSRSVPGFQYRDFSQTILETANQYLVAKKEGFQIQILPFS